jgi:hypothetical protein
VLRIVPAFGDFWLDEIWSFDTVHSVRSAWEIFAGVHDSNNHHLYSLLLYWIGDRELLVLYRMPALVAGIASVPLAAVLVRRHGRLEALLAAFLVGFSFVLIFFSSEARGYALAVGFALAATWLLERDRERPSLRLKLAFSACSILGLLSHLTFLFFVAGAGAVSFARLVRRREAPARDLLALGRQIPIARRTERLAIVGVGPGGVHSGSVDPRGSSDGILPVESSLLAVDANVAARLNGVPRGAARACNGLSAAQGE